MHNPVLPVSMTAVWLIVILIIERFSNKCRKTKTKAITPPITKNKNYPMNQSELEASTCNRRQARENACEREQVATDWFEFYS